MAEHAARGERNQACLDFVVCPNGFCLSGKFVIGAWAVVGTAATAHALRVRLEERSKRRRAVAHLGDKQAKRELQARKKRERGKLPPDLLLPGTHMLSTLIHV